MDGQGIVENEATGRNAAVREAVIREAVGKRIAKASENRHSHGRCIGAL
jgi:hypothetical protein